MGLIENDPYRFGRPGYTNNPPTQEYLAAQALLEAARLIQGIVYSESDAADIDRESMDVLKSTYRALEKPVTHYWGREGSLFCELEPEPEPEAKPKKIGLPFRKVTR